MTVTTPRHNSTRVPIISPKKSTPISCVIGGANCHDRKVPANLMFRYKNKRVMEKKKTIDKYTEAELTLSTNLRTCPYDADGKFVVLYGVTGGRFANVAAVVLNRC